MKNRYKIEKLPYLDYSEDVVSKFYVDEKANDPSILKNTAYVDFNLKSHDSVRFDKVNSLSAIRETLSSFLFHRQNLC